MKILKHKYIIIILLIINSIINIQIVGARSNKPNEEGLTDLSIVIASCDKYSGLWEPFFSLLFKHWPSLLDEKLDNQLIKHKIPIFLISNTKTYNKNNNRIKHMLFPNEISWSDNMLKTLSKVKTKYVLYLQEDYFLNKPVNEQLLVDILNYAKINNAMFIQISTFNSRTEKIKKINNNINLSELDKYSPYKVNLQAGIWNKQAFEWLIKLDENLVQFEQLGSIRSQGMPGLFLVYTDNNTSPIQYINAAGAGFLLQTAVDYVHTQGIHFDPKLQQLPVDQDNKFKIMIMNLKNILIHNLVKCKNFIIDKFIH